MQPAVINVSLSEGKQIKYIKSLITCSPVALQCVDSHMWDHTLHTALHTMTVFVFSLWRGVRLGSESN